MGVGAQRDRWARINKMKQGDRQTAEVQRLRLVTGLSRNGEASVGALSAYC
jgi:hypothetical protein